MNKQIKLGAIISYLSLAVNSFLTIAYLPWMVSIIGESNYALYTLSTSLISIFMIDFGLSTAVSRFLAKFIAEGEKEKVSKLITTIETLYVLMSFVIFIILLSYYFLVENIYIGLTIAEIRSLKQLYLIVMIYSVVSFPCIPFSGILNAYEKFIELKMCDLLYKGTSTVLIVICLLLGGNVLSITICNSLSGLIVIFIKYYIITKKLSIKMVIGKIDYILFKDIFFYSIWITIIILCQRCVFNIAPSILGIFSNSTEIAEFAPANSLESNFYMLSSAVNGLFLPTISRYIVQNDNDKIYKLLVKVGRYQFILLSLVYVGFFCIGKEFMIVWMGDKFTKTYFCVLFLFVPDIFLFTQQIANTTAIAKNVIKEQVPGYIGMAVLCLLFSCYFCRLYGAVGSAISICFSYVFLVIYLNIVYIKKMQIDMIKFYKECYLRLILFILIAGFICYYICSIIDIKHLLSSMIIKSLLIILIYTIIVFFGLEDEERMLIKSILVRSYNRRVKNDR